MLESLTSEMIAAVREVEQTFINDKVKENITSAPEKYIKNLRTVKIKNGQIPTWLLDFDLWINGEQSDWTVKIEIKEINGKIKAELYDLHVL